MDQIRQIPIDKIRVKRRVRGEQGDLTSLVASLGRYGQLSPIIVSEDYELIAGGRRLEAARQLGWPSLSALVTQKRSAAERLELELEENMQRLNLTSDEIADGFTRLERRMSAGPLRRVFRMLAGLVRGLFGKRAG